MQRVRLLLQILGAVALVLLIFCLGIVAHVLWQVAPSVEPTVRDMHTTVLEAGLTLKNLKEASQSWKEASEKQTSETTQAMSNLSGAARNLSGFISRTDESLNSRVLPSLTDMLTQSEIEDHRSPPRCVGGIFDLQARK